MFIYIYIYGGNFLLNYANAYTENVGSSEVLGRSGFTQEWPETSNTLKNGNFSCSEHLLRKTTQNTTGKWQHGTVDKTNINRQRGILSLFLSLLQLPVHFVYNSILSWREREAGLGRARGREEGGEEIEVWPNFLPPSPLPPPPPPLREGQEQRTGHLLYVPQYQLLMKTDCQTNDIQKEAGVGLGGGGEAEVPSNLFVFQASDRGKYARVLGRDIVIWRKGG